MSKRDWANDWELCQRATPGPWKWKIGTFGVPTVIDSRGKMVVDCGGWSRQGEWDTMFIAEARESLPYWLHLVKEMQEALDYCEIALTHVGNEKEKYEQLALEKIRQLREGGLNA